MKWVQSRPAENSAGVAPAQPATDQYGGESDAAVSVTDRERRSDTVAGFHGWADGVGCAVHPSLPLPRSDKASGASPEESGNILRCVRLTPGCTVFTLSGRYS
jgi:hypothetical protein